MPDAETTRPAAPFTIRPAIPDDAETIVELIRELADYEHLEHEAQATPEAFRQHLFGPRPFAEAMIAEVDRTPVGFALYFHTLLDLPGTAEPVPGRRVRPSRSPRPGNRQGLSATAGPAGRRARLRPAGMGRPRLERALDRLLPVPRRPADGRVDRLPTRRRGPGPAGGINWFTTEPRRARRNQEVAANVPFLLPPPHRPHDRLRPGRAAARAGGIIKLNTNENPYPPSPRVAEAIARGLDGRLRRYPDPLGTAFREASPRG